MTRLTSLGTTSGLCLCLAVACSAGDGPSGSGGSPGSTGGAAATGGVTGTGGGTSTGGAVTTGGSGGATSTGGKAESGTGGGTTTTGGVSGTGGAGGSGAKFSFFVTSLKALLAKSGKATGFGGNLTFGETGAGAGLRGADKICASIAEDALAGAGQKPWRAFLSAAKDENGKQVDAIDRVGAGPWYDRLGRIVAMTKADLVADRPKGAHTAIINDLPNEDGVPNHAPDSTQGKVDNHHMMTGSTTQGKLYAATATCLDWTSNKGERATDGRPRVGLAWPRGSSGASANWMSAMDEAGCAPTVSLVEMGGPVSSENTVGSGGGYGGFYCFSLVP